MYWRTSRSVSPPLRTDLNNYLHLRFVATSGEFRAENPPLPENPPLLKRSRQPRSGRFRGFRAPGRGFRAPGQRGFRAPERGFRARGFRAPGQGFRAPGQRGFRAPGLRFGPFPCFYSTVKFEQP
jgi:hypothetical protein